MRQVTTPGKMCFVYCGDDHCTCDLQRDALTRVYQGIVRDTNRMRDDGSVPTTTPPKGSNHE